VLRLRQFLVRASSTSSNDSAKVSARQRTDLPPEIGPPHVRLTTPERAGGESHEEDEAHARAEDIGSGSIGSENGGAVHDGLAGSDPDDRGDCAEHRDEENYCGERAGANSRPLATRQPRARGTRPGRTPAHFHQGSSD
jgi:hypothetical protein